MQNPSARGERDRHGVIRHPDADGPPAGQRLRAPASAAPGTTIVSGPGQHRARQPPRAIVNSPACRACATSAAISVSAEPSARPFSSNSRRPRPRSADRRRARTACRSGYATTRPSRIISAASRITAGSGSCGSTAARQRHHRPPPRDRLSGGSSSAFSGDAAIRRWHERPQAAHEAQHVQHEHRADADVAPGIRRPPG